tara:strand:+ start:83 stop:286 length:204 start_codon:yes stop_codon:yes gene_type:complete
MSKNNKTNPQVYSGIFRFKYTELKNKTEIISELVIETKDVVRSIGRFGESRKLVKLDVKQLNNKNYE